MMKYVLIFITIFVGMGLAIEAQVKSVKQSELRSEISRISSTLKSLRDSDAELRRTISSQKKEIDSLSDQLAESQANIKKLADSTNVTISEISLENENSQSRLQEIDQTISKRTIIWVITIIILSLLGVTSFVLFRKRLTSNTQNFDSRIAATKEALENMQSGVNKRDAGLAELLQNQLALLKEKELWSETGEAEINHKLPLKVGDEIHRMRKRIANLPQDVKGLGALRNSLTRLEEEFNDSGYEIENLSGKKYVDGMNMEARFVENPNIPSGEEIITDVLRPQIGYRGTVIQIAKVEVGKSY